MFRWGRKHFETGQYLTHLKAFEKAFIVADDPRDMIMIEANSEDPVACDVFIHAPEGMFSGLFADFEPMSDDELPKEAKLVIGHQDEFERDFKYPSRYGKSGSPASHS